MRLFRIGEALPTPRTELRRAMNFLQKHQIRPGLHNPFPDPVEDEATVTAAEALVDIVSENAQLRHRAIRGGRTVAGVHRAVSLAQCGTGWL